MKCIYIYISVANQSFSSNQRHYNITYILSRLLCTYTSYLVHIIMVYSQCAPEPSRQAFNYYTFQSPFTFFLYLFYRFIFQVILLVRPLPLFLLQRRYSITTFSISQSMMMQWNTVYPTYLRASDKMSDAPYCWINRILLQLSHCSMHAFFKRIIRSCTYVFSSSSTTFSDSFGK